MGAGAIEEEVAHDALVVEGRNHSLRVVSCDSAIGLDVGRMVADSGNTVVGFEYTVAGLEDTGTDLVRAAVDSECTGAGFGRTVAGCCRNCGVRFEGADELAAAELAGDGEVVVWTGSLEWEGGVVGGLSPSRDVAGVSGKGWIVHEFSELPGGSALIFAL